MENGFTSEVVNVVPAPDGSFTATIGAFPGDKLYLATHDAARNSSPQVTVSVPGSLSLPSDPATLAPTLDPSVNTDPCAATAFLYSGASPIQTGTVAGAIDCGRVILLQGRVIDNAGGPLSGVRVSVAGQPELGGTLTRTDGRFDLVANGGGHIVVRFAKPGWLPVDRRVTAGWREHADMADVVMLAVDTASTVVDLSAAIPVQVARGTAVTDADGTRQATLLFAQGTQAEAVDAGGAIRPLDSLTVRATEYTVGALGPASMPAELPRGTSYTYAVELSVDEVGGAESVRFSQPVAVYLENFVGLPTGTAVPAGYYDRAEAAWQASRDGRIVEVVGLANGMAEIDVDGSGAAADAATLAALGITDAERTELASLYTVGQSLWRVEVDHFTTWDFNYWAWFADVTAALERQLALKQQLAELGMNFDRDVRLVDCDEVAAGSVIECTNQVLGESIGGTNAGTALHYRSDRVPGRLAARTLEIPLSGATLPAGTKRIELRIEAGGQRVVESFPADPNLTYVFTWDGTDKYGRAVQGRIPAKVRLGYVYDGAYQRPRTTALRASGAVARVRSHRIPPGRRSPCGRARL